MADKTKPDRIEVFKVPKTVFGETWNYLRDRGRRQLEGVAYWTGSATPAEGCVQHVLFPLTYDDESDVHIEVGRGEVMRIAEIIHGLDEFLLTRIHSHPWSPFHSYSDDHGCLSGRVGMISIVIPRFAKGRPTLRGAAIYERSTAGSWRQLSSMEARTRFRII